MKHKFYSFLLCSLMLLVVGPGMAQTNTSHENAELIELDQEVTYSHASSPAAQTLYFKFNVEAEKSMKLQYIQDFITVISRFMIPLKILLLRQHVCRQMLWSLTD